MSESKARRTRAIVSDKIDKGTTAYHIVVVHLGGPSEAAEIAKRPIPTVYGWLQRGRVPAGQQDNLSTLAAAAGKGFPADWFLKVPEGGQQAAEAA